METKIITLRDSIRQSRPFESLEVEGLLTLIWAADRASCEAHLPLREHDLSSAQYNVLRILRGSPDGLLVREVLDRLVTRAPNITRLVDKLAAKGMLSRERRDDDRRAITLRITPEGQRLLALLDESMESAIGGAMRGLDSAELETMIGLLNRLRAPLDG